MLRVRLLEKVCLLTYPQSSPPRRELLFPKPQWRMLVDEAIHLKISHWFAKKNKMAEPTCEMIKMLKNKGIVVKVIRLDNAGEKALLEKRCKSKD
jgi:hypothetical protein